MSERISSRRIDPDRLMEAEELMTIDPEAVVFEAESGNPESQFHLGMSYLSGNHVEPSESEGAKWMSRCASKGYAEAQYAMSRLFLDGRGVSKSIPKAVELVVKSAEQGCHHAQYTLGVMKAYGILVEADPQGAATMFNGAMEQDHPESTLKLALMMCEGYGIPRDEEGGASLIAKAAEAGDMDAKFMMRKGELDWNSVDWFVDLGTPCIGPTYIESELFAEYDSKLIDSMSEKANEGSMEAQAYLGGLCLDGILVEESETLAKELLGCAFANGDAYSGYLLGVLSMDEDLAKAYMLISSAADEGIPDAVEFLGEHKSGETLTEYLRRAASGYMSMSRGNDSEAMYRLGVMHINGWGVPRSEQKALDWLERAHAAGHPEAQELMDSLF